MIVYEECRLARNRKLSNEPRKAVLRHPVRIKSETDHISGRLTALCEKTNATDVPFPRNPELRAQFRARFHGAYGRNSICREQPITVAPTWSKSSTCRTADAVRDRIRAFLLLPTVHRYTGYYMMSGAI